LILTYVFLPPSVNIEIETYLKAVINLNNGLSDVIAGIIPLSSVVLMSYFDATIPYLPAIVKTIVPCPKSIPGTDKLLTTFSLSVWLTIGLVLLQLCSGVPVMVSTGVCNDTHTYQSLSSCFQNAWAVLMAVSVPQQPTTFDLIVYFFLYDCFYFAISTVIQAFFVSYLVEPKYERKIETLDELLNSDVVYGYYPALNFAAFTVTYPEFITFSGSKKPKEYCSDMRKCIK